MHNFVINDFDGPLDLLLHLLKQSKMDIFDINIAQITQQYVDFINKMEKMNLDIASEYLVMASELIEMKSRHLLPKKEEEVDEYEENPEDELKRRLLEYQIYKESTEKFKELEDARHEVYTKSPEKISDLSDTKIINNDVTTYDLLEALQRVLGRLEKNKPITTKVARRELSVRDRVIKIREILSKKKIVKFEELFESVSREYVVVTFLSILTMARDNEIKLSQKNNFGEIYLERVD
jgi:segregation and condensation protein A